MKETHQDAFDDRDHCEAGAQMEETVDHDYDPDLVDPEEEEEAAEALDEDVAAETVVTSEMASYVCLLCGYIYDPVVGDPDNGVPAGTAFEDVPEDWLCPLCGAGKDQFERQ